MHFEAKWLVKTPYEVLRILPTAGPDDVRAAYKRIAVECHPDRSPAPDASRRMAEVNAAYALLREPETRARLDTWLTEAAHAERTVYERANERQSRSGTSPPAQSADPPSFSVDDLAKEVRCKSCKQINHTLRVIYYPTVVSLFVIRIRDVEGGVLCSDCAPYAGLKASIISMLFGWWSFNGCGVILTIEALLRVLSGTPMTIPPDTNASLLRAVSLVLVSRGKVVEARRALTASLFFQRDPEAIRVLNELGGRTRDIAQTTWRHTLIRTAAIIAFTSAIGTMIGIGVVAQAARAAIFPHNVATTPSAAPSNGAAEWHEGTEVVWYSNRDYTALTLSAELKALQEKETTEAAEVAFGDANLRKLSDAIDASGKRIDFIESKNKGGIPDAVYDDYARKVKAHNKMVADFKSAAAAQDIVVADHNVTVAEYNYKWELLKKRAQRTEIRLP